MKRGLLSRLFGPREFEASRRWQPSLTQPVAEPRPAPFSTPFERPQILARYFDLNWRHALASGFFAGLCLGLLYAPAALKGDQEWYIPIIAAVGAFSLISAIVWGILIFYDRKGLAWLEKQLGIDINRDGSIGEPQSQREPFRFEWTDPSNRQMEFDELPAATDEEMIEIARAVLQLGCPLSRRGLAGTTSLSEEASTAVLADMRNKGLARFKKGGSSAGTELTGKGRALLSGLLSK